MWIEHQAWLLMQWAGGMRHQAWVLMRLWQGKKGGFNRAASVKWFKEVEMKKGPSLPCPCWCV